MTFLSIRTIVGVYGIFIHEVKQPLIANVLSSLTILLSIESRFLKEFDSKSVGIILLKHDKEESHENSGNLEEKNVYYMILSCRLPEVFFLWSFLSILGIEFLYGHTTASMGIGYMSSRDKHPTVNFNSYFLSSSVFWYI